MTEVVKPNLKNFIKSLREVGYNFHIALADILDNSIAANAKNILIETEIEPEISLSILDDGTGMSEEELIEAMRLGSKDPDDEREDGDLGRFGLGLKTASFSQCKRLTVVSKKNGQISARAWDLEILEEKNEWILIKPLGDELSAVPLYDKLVKQKEGTLVIWNKIDGISVDDYYDELESLIEHLSLVFHRFLDGDVKRKKLNIKLNNNALPIFNPFNEQNHATQVLPEQLIKIGSRKIKITPYILPHHSKLSNEEHAKYGMKDGYTKTQGFYLYREGRLLIHGTWWGLNKLSDAHRLVRIKIDIQNDQDDLWNIDVKKSIANPNKLIKNELRKILNQVLSRGERTYTKRATIIKDNSTVPFWEVAHQSEEIRFILNENHPLFLKLRSSLSDENIVKILTTYLKGIESYIPLAAIQAHMVSDPHKVNQTLVEDDDKRIMFEELLRLDFTEDEIKELLETELFKNFKGDVIK